jgi:hypothetical protein
MAPVLSFKNKDVCHPHGNVLSADTFFRGVINSATDFTLYNHTRENGPGMEGIDFAFYQGGQIPHEVASDSFLPDTDTNSYRPDSCSLGELLNPYSFEGFFVVRPAESLGMDVLLQVHYDDINRLAPAETDQFTDDARLFPSFHCDLLLVAWTTSTPFVLASSTPTLVDARSS